MPSPTARRSPEPGDAEFEAHAVTGRIPSVGDTSLPKNDCLAPMVTLRTLVPRRSK